MFNVCDNQSYSSDGLLDGKCAEICPRHYNPMCGSDGKTYGNECTFGAAKCKSRGKLRLKKQGECGMANAVHF